MCNHLISVVGSYMLKASPVRHHPHRSSCISYHYTRLVLVHLINVYTPTCIYQLLDATHVDFEPPSWCLCQSLGYVFSGVVVALCFVDSI
jgi:hypothetical protein